MSNKDRTPEVDTALHVIKGAIVKVLHTPITVTTASKKNEGRLTVEYELGKITDEQLKKIEELSNQKIRENVPVIVAKMDRAEAEKKFEGKVNETFIYDKIPVPAKVTEISVLHIDGWNVNCCAGTHCPTTGGIGSMKVLRANYRDNKKELEFVFEVYPNSNQEDKGSVAAPLQRPPLRLDDIPSVAEKLVAEMFATLKEHNVDISGKEEAIRIILKPRIANEITIVKNHAYTSGFTATKTDSTSML